jgi:hypothetical protein
MGSISIDKAGDIALGYSASNGSSVFPSLRYATRAPGDPAGTLQPEQVLQAGGGSQTSSGHRWGDYSAMAVDPANACTFWYTNEYYPTTSSSAWHTRVGNFVVPACAANAPAFSASPSPVDFGSQALGSSSAARTMTVTNNGSANLTISSVALTGANAGDFSKGADSCTGATLTPTQSCTVGAVFAPAADGARAAALRFTDNATGSPHDVTLSGNGTGPSPGKFSLGKLKRNKKKGTAELTVHVPGPGELALTGKGVKPQRLQHRAKGARLKPVGAAGDFKLKIKATGNKKHKLNRTGKVKLKTKVTYTATGGSPVSKSKKVKLKKKLR